jgi:predicted PurR-regulated permease PerM
LPKAVSAKAPGDDAGLARLEEERLEALARYAVIGLFVLAAFTTMRFLGDLLAPIILAIIVGSLLSQLVAKVADYGAPPLASSIVLVTATILGMFYFLESLLEPLQSFIGQIPSMLTDIANAISIDSEPFSAVKRGLLSLASGQGPLGEGGLASVAGFFGGVTPAIGEFFIFFATLVFFIAGRQSLRRKMILTWSDRPQRMSAIRILNAIENSLALYFAASAMVYLFLGVSAASLAVIFGLPKPVLWGVITFLASFIPYFGTTLITLSLAACSFVVHHKIGLGFAPAAIYLAIHVICENAVLPAVVGRRLELNPFVVFIAIVFWSWMWGAVGAILAAPLLMVFDTILSELRETPGRLPG